MSVEKQVTPLMRQYFEVKDQYPDTILLFQVGDFYELFFDDALKAAAVLGIALTKRGTYNGEPIPLCGVPLHVLDHYLSKLVRAGFKVALCDQLEIPKPGKLVDRKVTQVLTPGTLTDSKLLNDKTASYLCIFFPTETAWAMLCAELLTGQLFATLFSDLSTVKLDAELSRFMPDEIVVPHTKLGETFGHTFQAQGYHVSYEPFNASRKEQALAAFKDQPISSDSMSGALTTLYTYLSRNNEQGLTHLKQFSVYKPEDYLMLDASTVKNLELVKNMQDGSSTSTLFSVLDQAVTAMGSRMLKKWLLRPLIKRERIEERLMAVEICVKDHALRRLLKAALNPIGDLERIAGRIALKRARLYDYRALIDALAAVPDIRSTLLQKATSSPLLITLAQKIDDLEPLHSLLCSAISDDPNKDWLIKEGHDSELDRLRSLAQGGAQEIAALEAKEQQRTGITSLKIRYNQVHGYGIEVTQPNLHLVPSDYLRIQTLANRERFTTQQLKDLERDLSRAHNEISFIEKELFEQLKANVENYIAPLKKLSYSIASIDALVSLADVASEYGYVRPTFNEEQAIVISDGRHPVVEARMRSQRGVQQRYDSLQTENNSSYRSQEIAQAVRTHAPSAYIPNSVTLNDEGPLWLITGPNMGGKSTFLRQVALIVHMAQMGSFVPASQASLAIVDRIFTRIGAADNVAEGKSTFLVEMEETALVCSQATRQSLVILDEVGRGTSTFDGLAIAQAVVEYIHTALKARCLFATHYHELMELCTLFPGIKAYHAASMKTAEGIVLLHKISPGVADGSFGLEVAQMARLPTPIVSRAREIIAALSNAPLASSVDAKALSAAPPTTAVLPEFQAAQRILTELESINVDEITPKQALDIMCYLKKLVENI